MEHATNGRHPDPFHDVGPVHETQAVRHPAEEDLGVAYHLATRLHAWDGGLVAELRRRRLARPAGRSKHLLRPDAPSLVALPASGPPPATPRVDLGALAFLLGAGAGAPSWCGPVPLETYVLADGVEGLPAGAYHHRPEPRVLEPVVEGGAARTLALARAADPAAPLALVLTAAWERVAALGGERAYRYALLEAGARTERIRAAAEAVGIGAACDDAIDEVFEETLDLDGVSESFLALLLVGGGVR